MNAGLALGISLRLAKAGYWGADPGRIMRVPADQVVAALQYEDFCNDYERASVELNRGS